jgi:hypothetical protein
MSTMMKAARHVGETAGPAEKTLQIQAYRNQGGRSRVNPLCQAGDILLLLSAFELGATLRLGFWTLFERRLRRAYAGVTR